RPSAASGVFWGAMSGFTSMLAQAGAPPFQVHMLPQKLHKLTLVGTNMIFFALVNWMMVLPFFLLGQFNSAYLDTSALLLPFADDTNSLGILLVFLTPNELFYKIAYWLMFVISAELMRGGVVGIWRG